MLLTLGHLDIIRKAIKIADPLIIGIANRTAKKTIFSAKKRARKMYNIAQNTL